MSIHKRLERLEVLARAPDKAEQTTPRYREAYFRALENFEREEAGLEPLPYNDIDRESDEHFLAETHPVYRSLPGWQREECREILDRWEQHTRERLAKGAQRDV
jgi:hypothetical protein